jgi:uncharacterized membrane protein
MDDECPRGDVMVRHIKFDPATSLVAWFYDAQKDAFQALLALQRVEHTRGLRSVGVADAAVMSEASRGRIRVDRTIEFREGSEYALGEIFPPAILTQLATGADAPSVCDHFSQLGFRGNVLREIGENLPRDGAALVVLLKEEWLVELQDILHGEVYMERWALDVEGTD